MGLTIVVDVLQIVDQQVAQQDCPKTAVSTLHHFTIGWNTKLAHLYGYRRYRDKNLRPCWTDECWSFSPPLNCGCLYAQFLLVKQESPILISKTHQNSVQTASENNHKPEHHSEKLEQSWKPLNMWSLKEETHSHRGLNRQIPHPSIQLPHQLLPGPQLIPKLPQGAEMQVLVEVLTMAVCAFH